jgi:hypothetical protein
MSGASSVFIDVTGFRVARDDRGRDYIVRSGSAGAPERDSRKGALVASPLADVAGALRAPGSRRLVGVLAVGVNLRRGHKCDAFAPGCAGLHHQDSTGLVRLDGVPALLTIQAAGRPGAVGAVVKQMSRRATAAVITRSCPPRPPPARPPQLRRKIPDCPSCPPKRMFGGHSPEFLETRRVELLDWVCTVRRCRRRSGRRGVTGRAARSD